MARGFEFLAVLLAAIGFLALLALIQRSLTIEANNDSAFLIIAASCFSLALWLFLIAQIIYIRANTER